MSKNSFTQNFNDCVAGLPIASVAAHMILHEGLGKDLLKVGVPAAIIAGLYNYGDDMATGISDWGAKHQDMKLGNWNIGQTAQNVGNKLNDWHTAGTHWMQDNWLGKAAGLGGQEALKRQTEEQGASEYLAQAAAAKQQELNDINRTISDPAARATATQQVENKYNSQAKAAGDYAWQQKLTQINGAKQAGQPNPQQPQGQQPQQQGQAQPGAEQFGPPRPNPVQATAATVAGATQAPISKPLPDANRALVGGALAGAAGGRAYASGGQPAQAQQPAPAASTTTTAVQNSVNAVNRGANAAPSTPAASVQTTATAVNQGVNATQSAGRASGSGYDFSEQDKLKKMNLGGSFIQDPNKQNPSPFGSRK